MGGIGALIISLLGGWRVFFGGLLMTILAIIMYNLCVELVEEVMQFALNKLQSSGTGIGESPSMGFSGFGAWVLLQFRFPECLAVTVNFVMLKWMLRKIPFIRW